MKDVNSVRRNPRKSDKRERDKCIRIEKQRERKRRGGEKEEEKSENKEKGKDGEWITK